MCRCRADAARQGGRHLAAKAGQPRHGYNCCCPLVLRWPSAAQAETFDKSCSPMACPATLQPGRVTLTVCDTDGAAGHVADKVCVLPAIRLLLWVRQVRCCAAQAQLLDCLVGWWRCCCRGAGGGDSCVLLLHGSCCCQHCENAPKSVSHGSTSSRRSNKSGRWGGVAAAAQHQSN